MRKLFFHRIPVVIQIIHRWSFCTKKKDRPNTIGLCTVELLAHSGWTITVKYLDAIDGTPVLDIKPVFKEFDVKAKIKQPDRGRI